MAAMAQAVYVGTLGTSPTISVDGDEMSGPEWMRERLAKWLGVEDEELRYELDPDAKPDPNFFQSVAEQKDQQGRSLLEIRRVRAAELQGPFADRLRQVIAERIAREQQEAAHDDVGNHDQRA